MSLVVFCGAGHGHRHVTLRFIAPILPLRPREDKPRKGGIREGSGD